MTNNDDNTATARSNDTMRWILVAALVVVAFFGAYKFASARSGQQAVASVASPGISGTQGVTGGTTGGPVADAAASGASADAATDPAAAGSACACCGSGAPTVGGVTGDPVEGTAAVAGDVQKIAVDVTSVYNPNTIILKAGVPAEITFSQAQGCTQVVQSKDLGFSEDLGSGPKTVKLQGLEPGTYSFECGMSMVFGKIVVR